MIVLLLGSASIWAYRRYQEEWRWSSYTPIARSYLTAVGAGDSTQAARLSGAVQPVEWASHLKNLRDPRIRRFVEGLRVGWGFPSSQERVLVTFYTSFDYCENEELWSPDAVRPTW